MNLLCTYLIINNHWNFFIFSLSTKTDKVRAAIDRTNNKSKHLKYPSVENPK